MFSYVFHPYRGRFSRFQSTSPDPGAGSCTFNGAVNDSAELNIAFDSRTASNIEFDNEGRFRDEILATSSDSLFVYRITRQQLNGATQVVADVGESQFDVAIADGNGFIHDISGDGVNWDFANSDSSNLYAYVIFFRPGFGSIPDSDIMFPVEIYLDFI